jgi:hypothetical protein
MSRLMNNLIDAPGVSRFWHVITIYRDGTTSMELYHSQTQAEFYMEWEAKHADRNANPVREFFVVETGRDRETVPTQFKISR